MKLPYTIGFRFGLGRSGRAMRSRVITVAAFKIHNRQEGLTRINLQMGVRVNNLQMSVRVTESLAFWPELTNETYT